MLTRGEAFCFFPEPLGSWPNEFSVACIAEGNCPRGHQHLVFGCLEIFPTFGLSSAAAATQAGRGTSKPTLSMLNKSELRKHLGNFPILAKSLYLRGCCEDGAPHARSTCVLCQSLLKLLWAQVPQKCQAGAELLTHTAVGGRAQGLLPRC